MNEFNDNLPPPYNPYAAPTDMGSVDNGYKLPVLHWPIFIGLFVLLLVVGLVTYGATIPFALALFFGAIRTALVFRDCRRLNCVPPSYAVSAIGSPILCFGFLVAAGTAFFFICAAGLGIDRRIMSEQAWLSMTGIISIAVFAILYTLSIKVSVASRKRA